MSTVCIAADPPAREHAIGVLTRNGITVTEVDHRTAATYVAGLLTQQGITLRDGELERLRLYHAGVRSRQQLAATQARLTRREFDVVQCLAQGLTSRQIGRCVGRTDSAIKDCLRSVYRKLGANDRAHAVLIACRLGILGGGS